MVMRMMGANINCRTVENVRRSGFEIVQVAGLAGGVIFKRITARQTEKETQP